MSSKNGVPIAMLVANGKQSASEETAISPQASVPDSARKPYE